MEIEEYIDQLILQLDQCGYSRCKRPLTDKTNSGLFCTEEHQAAWQYEHQQQGLTHRLLDYPNEVVVLASPLAIAAWEIAGQAQFDPASVLRRPRPNWSELGEGRLHYDLNDIGNATELNDDGRGLLMVGGPMQGQVGPRSAVNVVQPDRVVIYRVRRAALDRVPRSTSMEFYVLATLDATNQELNDALNEAHHRNGWMP